MANPTARSWAAATAAGRPLVIRHRLPGGNRVDRARVLRYRVRVLAGDRTAEQQVHPGHWTALAPPVEASAHSSGVDPDDLAGLAVR